MRKTLEIPVKTFSVNSMTYRDATTKTSQYMDWSYQVFHSLSGTKSAQTLKELREYFDPSKHQFVVRLVAFYPPEIYKTKDGKLSGRTHDLTNWEKPVVDLIFSSRFFTQPHPYGCENINTDDKYVTAVHSYKKSGPDYKIVATIWIKPL